MNKTTLIGQNFDEAAYAIDGERRDNFDPMLKAFDASYKQWDALLNEIYGTLKSRLSSSEFTVLRDVQRN
ncbi:lysozyme inhibitor LprI family protein [Kurthia gibsonii]|uniref:lysozyme inhibitor LprI family protein n=1 Tax=Kurthia gibsonii TaxID=33946 RepID=UPI0031B730FF